MEIETAKQEINCSNDDGDDSDDGDSDRRRRKEDSKYRHQFDWTCSYLNHRRCFYLLCLFALSSARDVAIACADIRFVYKIVQ